MNRLCIFNYEFNSMINSSYIFNQKCYHTPRKSPFQPRHFNSDFTFALNASFWPSHFPTSKTKRTIFSETKLRFQFLYFIIFIISAKKKSKTWFFTLHKTNHKSTWVSWNLFSILSLIKIINQCPKSTCLSCPGVFSMPSSKTLIWSFSTKLWFQI